MKFLVVLLYVFDCQNLPSIVTTIECLCAEKVFNESESEINVLYEVRKILINKLEYVKWC